MVDVCRAFRVGLAGVVAVRRAHVMASRTHGRALIVLIGLRPVLRSGYSLVWSSLVYYNIV